MYEKDLSAIYNHSDNWKNMLSSELLLGIWKGPKLKPFLYIETTHDFGIDNLSKYQKMQAIRVI